MIIAILKNLDLRSIMIESDRRMVESDYMYNLICFWGDNFFKIMNAHA